MIHEPRPTMTDRCDASRRAIIDIGSNSLRLVIYEGPARTPFVVHNEKVQARLGRGLAGTGLIDPEAYAAALGGCRRFKALLDAAGIRLVRTVATAAVRDARNGPEFLAEVRAIGLDPEMLSGEAEALGSAAGVLSAFPGANGIVGDLGGGSLELIDLRQGEPDRRQTFPFGVLRLPALRARSEKDFAALVAAELRSGGWRKAGAGRPLWLVGGAWRALGHVDMHLAASIAPGVHGYAFARTRIAALREAIAEHGARLGKVVAGLSSARVPGLDEAAMLLDAVGAQLGCDGFIVSGFGLREGLLFSALDGETRRQDPLLAAVADYAARRGAMGWDGHEVATWIGPLFADEDSAAGRIRDAACHLAGVDMHPQSETRARHGMELAWLGAWIGLDLDERAMLAQAMWTAWGGKGHCPYLVGLASAERLATAVRWGEAIRLAERLSGGVTSILSHASLARVADRVILAFDSAWRDLAGTVVARQLTALAQTFGASAAIVEHGVQAL